MSLLDGPRAQALLNDAKVSTGTVRGLIERLTGFLGRYLPLFDRKEQRENVRVVLEGKLSGLERKTSEPIAHEAGVERKPIQNFVGASNWDDEAVTGEIAGHVGEVLGDPDGALVFDSSGFAKKGTESCGVKRQWCGRLGKLENCQVGVFLGYVTPQGKALVDRQLYLPRDWAADAKRRKKCHVPKDVKFQEKWRIALDLLDRRGAAVPHGWAVADDEFGRVSAFREALRARHEHYVLDIPCNTLIREIGSHGPFERADEWVKRQPSRCWQKIRVADGEKGPQVVRALHAQVQAKDEDGCIGPREVLLATRTVSSAPEHNYSLSNVRNDVNVQKLVQIRRSRHGIEELFQGGKGEVGLDHYEVRSWVGWHHHMTLSMLALWFLQLEQLRVKKKRRP